MTRRIDEPTEAQLTEVLAVARRAAVAAGATPTDADDVAQATVVKLLERWNAGHVAVARTSGGAPRWRAYVAATARNVYTDSIRTHSRRVAREQRAGQLFEERPRPGGRADEPSYDHIEQAVMRSVLLELVTQMPSHLRECMWLVYVEQYTVAEVAAYLALDRSTVRKRLARARARLQHNYLQGELPAPGSEAVVALGASPEREAEEVDRVAQPMATAGVGLLDDQGSLFAIEEFGDALSDPANIVTNALKLLSDQKLREFRIPRD